MPEFLDFPMEIKEVSETGVFEGYGSVFGNKDSHGDVVLPGAFRKTLAAGGRNKNGIAMLLQHDPRRPIGVWTMLAEDSHGLKVEGKLAMGTQDGRETYELMKMGALKGLSIGYDTVDHQMDRNNKTRFLKEVDLWEISPVTFGSNILAGVTAIKAEVDADWKNIIPCKEISLVDNGAKFGFCSNVLKKYFEFEPDDHMATWSASLKALEDLQTQWLKDFESLQNQFEHLKEKTANLCELKSSEHMDKIADVLDTVNYRLHRLNKDVKVVDFTSIENRIIQLSDLFRDSLKSSTKSTYKGSDKAKRERTKPKRSKTVYERLGFYPGSEQAERILLGDE